MPLKYIPLHYTDPASDWQNNDLNSAFDQVSQSVCNSILMRLIQPGSNFGPCAGSNKIGQLCACAIWCQNAGYACMLIC